MVPFVQVDLVDLAYQNQVLQLVLGGLVAHMFLVVLVGQFVQNNLVVPFVLVALVALVALWNLSNQHNMKYNQ